MGGPAPAVADVRRAVRAQLRPQVPVIVACSGGPDSTALAAAAAFEAPRAGVGYALATVDHGLQPDSAAQARRIAALAGELGFDPVWILPVDVGTAGGREAAARAARYAALAAVAERQGADVLLGHTRDDQAETVLLGLGRGSGPRSIAGMRLRDGRWVRPLLDIPRTTTVTACESLGLPTWDDPHNADSGLQRVRLRREVLPLLEEVLQGGVAAALARTARLLQDDLDALDELAAQVPAGPDGVAVAALTGLPRALRTRVLRRWALTAGASELTAGHLASLDALVSGWRGQGAVSLPGGLSARRVGGTLCVMPPSTPPTSRTPA
jgi:tRNA(Ile)-lysidine synthase